MDVHSTTTTCALAAPGTARAEPETQERMVISGAAPLSLEIFLRVYPAAGHQTRTERVSDHDLEPYGLGMVVDEAELAGCKILYVRVAMAIQRRFLWRKAWGQRARSGW